MSIRSCRPIRLWALCGLAGAAIAAQAQTPATGDSRSVTQPVYPRVCATLTAQFTASQRSSPPAADDTQRLQAALKGCAGTGNSVVLAASGAKNAFFTNSLTLQSQALVINGGVTLYGSNGYSNSEQLVLFTGNNAALMGPGTIDGRQDLISGTPRLVQVKHFNNFTAYNITLKQAAKMHLYAESGTGFTAWGVSTRTPSTVANTDGIDLDSLTDATIIHSSIEAGDDGIAVKTNDAATANVTVSDTRLYGTHGLSIGSQTMYGVRNVLFQNNYVYGQDLQGTYAGNSNAINIKTDPVCGGSVQQVTYKNTCIKGGKHLIVLDTSYGYCVGKPGTPKFSNILINGVYATNSQAAAYSKFDGQNAGNLIDVTLAHVHLDATTLSTSQYTHASLVDSNLKPAGTGVTTSNAAVNGSVPACTF